VDTSSRAHANWPDRFFARITDDYLAATNNRGGLVGDASCHLMSAKGLLEFALPVMKAVSHGAGVA
jgi:hypothetical protein